MLADPHLPHPRLTLPPPCCGKTIQTSHFLLFFSPLLFSRNWLGCFAAVTGYGFGSAQKVKAQLY